MVDDKHSLGSGPIEGMYREQMERIARALDAAFNRDAANKQVGFILMTFNFGDKPGRCNYISNADRQDIIVLLREQLSYFEGAPDDQKGHA
jgi:hypothetical protein